MTTSFVKCAKHRHKFIAVQRLNHSSWKYSTASSSTDHQLNEIQPKPFRTIPGPSGPLGLGSIFNYFRFVGTYSWEHLDKCGQSKYIEYGHIVRETMLPGVHVVWLFDPNDIARVLNDFGSGAYPQRTSHLALQKYRRDRPLVYPSGGLLPTNGEDWWRMRSEFQKGLSSPKAVRSMLPDSEQIIREWLQHLDIQDSLIIPDMLPELSRLNLELVSHLAFDVRLNGFTADERSPLSVTSRLMEAALTTNDCILPTDQGLQMWRHFETPVYRKLRTAQEFMESIAIDLVSQKISHFREDKSKNTLRGRSILEEYLSNPNLDFTDIVVMATDFLLAGIDTTSYTSSFLLYHLATNKTAQERLYQETCEILPSPDATLDEEKFNNRAPYARAVLKECLRLNPISIGVGRNLNSDLVLSGYEVPKGTMVVTQNMVACRLPQHFVDPETFIPERWLRGHEKRVSVNPYLVLPFGHGMRACIARRLAEQSMLAMIIMLIRRFEISWCGDENLGVHTRLINRPDQQICIEFKSRQ